MTDSQIRAEHLKATSLAIKKLSEAFNCNPWNFMYESDVEHRLMSFLLEEISKEVVYKNIKERDSRFCGNDSISLSPVRSQYGYCSYGKKFDLAIIDPKYDPNQLLFNQDVSVAIEIKLTINPEFPEYADSTECDIYQLLQRLDDEIDGVRRITSAGVAILCILPGRTNVNKWLNRLIEKMQMRESGDLSKGINLVIVQQNSLKFYLHNAD